MGIVMDATATFEQAGVGLQGLSGCAMMPRNQEEPYESSIRHRVRKFAATQAFAQAGFPPPPPKVSPAAGVIDMHVHSHPDVFGRNMDDIDVAQLAKSKACAGSSSRTTSRRSQAARRS